MTQDEKILTAAKAFCVAHRVRAKAIEDCRTLTKPCLLEEKSYSDYGNPEEGYAYKKCFQHHPAPRGWNTPAQTEARAKWCKNCQANLTFWEARDQAKKDRAVKLRTLLKYTKDTQ